MAISRVVGSVDSVPVILKHVEGDVWEIPIPTNFKDGRYFVEIFAYNYAEQHDFWSGVLYIMEGRCARMEVQKCKVIAKCFDDHKMNVRMSVSESITLVLNTYSPSEQIMRPQSADYVITKDGDQIANGTCTISGPLVHVPLGPFQEAGVYNLAITYTVFTATRVSNFLVVVTE